MSIQKNCKVCWKGFHVTPSRTSTAKYCSIKCKLTGTTTGKYAKCDKCEAKVWKFNYQKKQVNFFCSKVCSFAFMVKEKHPNYKKSRSRIDSHGYIWLKDEKIYEHRAIMEKQLGRKLAANEQVHHVNGIKTDNRKSNLVVLSNSDHQKIHAKENIGYRWALLYDCCTSCGTTNRKHNGNGLCKSCYMRDYFKRKGRSK